MARDSTDNVNGAELYSPPPPSIRDPDEVVKIDLVGYPHLGRLQLLYKQELYKNMIVGFSIRLRRWETIQTSGKMQLGLIPPMARCTSISLASILSIVKASRLLM
ncbi:MAG: hypothetical protein SPI14_02560 [Arcanobacterium sp.]|nr:hypothetical protein [Arcanobacterium sp.]